jgi:hypothetical protein
MTEVRLNKTDLEAIERETRMIAPPAPTLESLAREGYRETRVLNAVLDVTSSAGRVVTLFVAEVIQAGAALIIAVVFAILEFFRVQHGAAALGQDAGQAALIAFAVVTANVVHPIYALRQLRGQSQLQIQRMTFRGWLANNWRRIVGKPRIESVDLYYNPTLHLAAAVITWSTVVLAVYDILSPLLTQIFTGNIQRPIPIMAMELLMGLGLSIAGVFFLQSAAHELGVRTLTDQPVRLVDVLQQRRAVHDEQIAAIRADVRARYVQAKIDERAKDKPTPAPVPFGSQVREVEENDNTQPTDPQPMLNERGHIVNGNVTK